MFSLPICSPHLGCGLLIGLVALSGGGIVAPLKTFAAVLAGGNVTPVPPVGGGNVAAPLLIGDTSVGTLAISGGTPLNVTGGSATVGDDDTAIGIVQITGAGSNLTTASDLTIGNNGSGRLSIDDFALITLADDLLLGVGDGSTGELIVEDLGVIVDVNDTVSIGNAGTAVIEVLGGGRVLADDTVMGTAATGIGRMVLSDPLTLWRQTNSMTVGDAGRATIEIVNEARLETTNVVFANGATGIANVVVSDASSVWDVTGFMNVGVSGTAFIEILNGGQIRNTSTVRLAALTGSEGHAEVRGAGTLWTIGTTVTVGEGGFGTVKVLEGGRITSTNVRLADNSGSRGEVTVDGNGSTWEITGTLEVSDPGEALLTISNQGLVKSTGAATIRAAGHLQLDGGRLEVASINGVSNQGLISGSGIIVGAVSNTAAGEIRTRYGDRLVLNNNLTNAGLIDLVGGETEVLGTTTNSRDIDVRDGILRFQNGITNSSGGQLAIVGGEVDVFGAITSNAGGQVVVGGEAHAAFHDNFTNNGELIVMPGAELLTLENLGFGAGSSLSMFLQPTDQTLPDSEPTDAYGQVHTSGTTTLAGTLSVTLLDGFSPELGDTFQIMTSAAGQSGVFGTEELPTLVGGLDWDVQYNANSVVLAVVSAAGLAGDYNNDGVVNAADYVSWRDHLGSGTSLPNDSTPGVTVGDYGVWKANFGNGSGSGAGAGTSVPEPTTFVLLLVGVIVAWWRR